MKHLIAAALAALMLAPPARANDCNWAEESFWDTAPAGRVAACIAAGADIAARNKGGGTPLHFAADESPEAIRALLDAGADVAARDEKGKTPLHRAARNGTPDAVRALIDAGANIRARDKDGELPADLAEGNDAVRNDPVYWVLHDGRFD
ncbi:MAG: ankyrin repeat domain-containing protein [Rhodobacteraceae bacterium]|nr:ankyrin repeat domain-containing protein [Paracoccaceae bacterium]